MRDPDLVFRAQVAASALERAWQRWRDVHGPAADSAPTVSSYVGYSLEEPWGEPRVVFGLPAEDAEQLVMLLDRHDCVGPVHALLAGQGVLQAAAQGQRLPVRVPAQASRSQDYGAADVGQQGRDAGQPYSDDRYDRDDEPVSDQDGPVFRQVAAAAQEASAAYVAAAARAAEQDGPGQDGPEQYGPGQGGAEQDGPEQDGPEQDGPGQADPILSFAVRDSGGGEKGYDDDRQPVDHSGPLALAASAAQAEAEVRIRASLRGGRPAVEFEYPYAAGNFDVTGSLPAIDDDQAEYGYGPSYARGQASDDADSEGRYAAGDDAGVGEQDAVVAFRPRTDAYAEDGQQPQAQDLQDRDLQDEDPQDLDRPDDGPQGHPGQGVARRNRISRGSAPRLSRTKRQGTVSGA
jgi:hypothetical protein